jgi:hypothetical protein
MRAQWLAIGAIASAAAVSFAVFITGITFADIAFFFQNGSEIEVVGNRADCVPTRGADICIHGFRDTSGNYFILSNLQEYLKESPNLAQQIREDDRMSYLYRITGTFTRDVPDFPVADVAGTIKIRSMVWTGSATPLRD